VIDIDILKKSMLCNQEPKVLNTDCINCCKFHMYCLLCFHKSLADRKTSIANLLNKVKGYRSDNFDWKVLNRRGNMSYKKDMYLWLGQDNNYCHMIGHIENCRIKRNLQRKTNNLNWKGHCMSRMKYHMCLLI